MLFRGILVKDGAEVKPAVKAFVLVFGVDKIQEIFFLEIPEFDVSDRLVVKVNNFFTT